MEDKNIESEDAELIGNSLPFSYTGIGTRISEIAERLGGKKNLSLKAGISQSHLYRYISGQSDLTASKLIALAKAGDVSVEWLATGNEEIKQGETANRRHDSDVDLELLESVSKAAFEELESRGLRLEPAAKARLVRVLYRHFASRKERPDQDTVSNIIDLAAYR